MTLIQAQQEAIEGILALPVQTRASYAYGHTLLNRSRRGLRRIRTQYFKRLSRMGFTEGQAWPTYRDVMDMAKLEANAADVEE